MPSSSTADPVPPSVAEAGPLPARHDAGLRASLRRTAAPLAAMRLVGQGAEFAAFVVLARTLGPADFGVVSIAYLIARYLGLVADWGATISGTRGAAGRLDATQIRALLAWRGRLAAASTVAFAGVAVAARRPELAPLALAVAGRGASRDWISLGAGRGARAATPSVVQGVGALLAAVGVALAGASIGAASAGLGAAAGAGLACSLALNPRPPGRATPATGVRQGWYLAVILADQVAATADVVLLGLLRSTAEAGVYAALYRIPNAWITVQGLVVAGLIPWATHAASGSSAELARLRRRLIRVGRRLGLAIALSAPVAAWLLPAIFGEAYTVGRAPLVLLLAGVAVSAVGASVQPLVFAAASDREVARWYLVAAVANVGVNLWAIPTFGMVGAAAVTASTLTVISAAMVGLSARIEPVGAHPS